MKTIFAIHENEHGTLVIEYDFSCGESTKRGTFISTKDKMYHLNALIEKNITDEVCWSFGEGEEDS